MTVAILADDVLKQEILTRKLPESVNVVWVDSMRSLTVVEADVYMDLLFEMDAERTQHLKRLQPKPVLVNAVSWSTKSIGADVVRINAWPGMLQRPVTEIAMPATVTEATIKEIFDQLQWKYILAPDIPGMITARVLAAIINEAYYTLESKVSTREEIDIAMKLGTSYPYGPFEWSEKIGLSRIAELLTELSRVDDRYKPAALLVQEAGSRKVAG
ncbi:3-hydroxyacyl-CoA dehydrogenase family protein [Longitalea luteola]|uniref:3-hydroxyacyl-CoA dehydrogenase family protein n=1 Tax=Longitalea luteola TaxID=2812563 RepID=UPI001A97132A|nr:3-hydroxyacyl-CoA dehydrogenase family protein [Longitalea luteola]